MPRIAVAAAATVAVVVGLVTACGGDEDTAPPPPAKPAASATSTPSAPPSSTAPATPASASREAAALPPAGTQFPGEGLSSAQANDLQRSVDQGHQPWRTDPKAVAEAFVQGRFGWTDFDSKLTDPHTAEVTNQDNGRVVSLQLRQPARVGEGGIWTVTGGVWIK